MEKFSRPESGNRSNNHTQTIGLPQRPADIVNDLSWVDMLKGIAIIGVFLENCLNYFRHRGLMAATEGTAFLITKIINTAAGPFVQVFFILSGFGLTLTFLKAAGNNWSWKEWTWRRFTKIVFPYYIFIFLTYILGIIGSLLYENVDMQFSLTSLLSHLTFTRNFYRPSWEWNPPLWYMPIVIGLYLIFPLLLILLKKLGAIKLLLMSMIITYGSLILGFSMGVTGTHGTDIFLYWTFQFSLGMILAHIYYNRKQSIGLMFGIYPLIIGSILLVCSWALRTYVPYGNIFNDSVTSVGVFLVLLNLGWFLKKLSTRIHNAFVSLSKPSYFMYLIHYPLLMFLLGPLFTNPLHPFIFILLVLVYIPLVYIICYFLTKPINNLSSKLFRVLPLTNK